MKIIRYTLLGNGKVPSAMVDGGYFPKNNGGQSPRDLDLIGFSLGWRGLEEYTTKLDFENYVKSLPIPELTSPWVRPVGWLQEMIDNFWARSLE